MERLVRMVDCFIKRWRRVAATSSEIATTQSRPVGRQGLQKR
jgi:hypothetical protein